MSLNVLLYFRRKKLRKRKNADKGDLKKINGVSQKPCDARIDLILKNYFYFPEQGDPQIDMAFRKRQDQPPD